MQAPQCLGMARTTCGWHKGRHGSRVTHGNQSQAQPVSAERTCKEFTLQRIKRANLSMSAHAITREEIVVPLLCATTNACGNHRPGPGGSVCIGPSSPKHDSMCSPRHGRLALLRRRMIRTCPHGPGKACSQVLQSLHNAMYWLMGSHTNFP